MSDVAEAAPRFCPRCEKPREGPGACRECGEALEFQGYCGVCENFWPLPEGYPCPKHDVPLEPGPPKGETPVEDQEVIDWVTVATFAQPGEAQSRRLRLEAEGIPVFLEGERMGDNVIYQVATGGVKLQVRRAQADDARVLLSQSWSPPGEIAGISDDDDEWEGDHAPHPSEGRKNVMRKMMIVYLLMPVALVLFVALMAALGVF